MNKKIKLNNDFTAASIDVSQIGHFIERSESVSERINKWYIHPLRQMKGAQGFMVLMILLPLYEKHLRVKYNVEDDFSEGHRVFEIIGKHLNLSKSSAYLFWTNVRNGLLHKALPKETSSFKYGLRDEEQSIVQDGDVFWINPFEMRDRLLEEIEPDIKSWKIDDVPLAKTFYKSIRH